MNKTPTSILDIYINMPSEQPVPEDRVPVGNEGVSAKSREVFKGGTATEARRASRNKDRPFKREDRNYENTARNKDRSFSNADNNYRRNSRQKELQFTRADRNYERRNSREKDLQITGAFVFFLIQ